MRILAGFWLVLLSCTPETNFWKPFLKPGDLKDQDLLVERAQRLYDRGKFEAALAEAEKAQRLDPQWAEAALILGSIHLALAGLDLIEIMKRINSKAEVSPSPTPSPTPSPSPEISSSPAPSGGSSGDVDKIGSLLGIEAGFEQKLSVPSNRVGEVEGAPSSGPFKELPVILPLSAVEAREQSLSKSLYHVNQAIKSICPFVEPSARVTADPADPRHEGDACPEFLVNSEFNSKFDFIWGFAHLYEGVIFQKVVLYQPPGASQPHLLKRVKAIESIDKSDIPGVIEAIKELKASLRLIMPTEAELAKNSMALAMFNDFVAANAAFLRLAGLPKKFTQRIENTVEQLEAQRAKISAQNDQKGISASGTDVVAQAISEKLGESIAKTLGDNINQRVESGEISTEQKTELCASYAQISAAALQACQASSQ